MSGLLMQLVAHDGTPSYATGDRLYINCNKAKELINNDNYDNTTSTIISRHGDSIENMIIEFKEDSRDTEWYPYSDLKQVSITVIHQMNYSKYQVPLCCFWMLYGLERN